MNMAPAIVPGWGVLTSMTTPQLRRYDVGLLTHGGSGCHAAAPSTVVAGNDDGQPRSRRRDCATPKWNAAQDLSFSVNH
jgi:hypothetical protein